MSSTRKKNPLSARAMARESKPSRTKVLPRWFAKYPERLTHFKEYLQILVERDVHVGAKDILVDLRETWPDFPVSHTALYDYMRSEGLQLPNGTKQRR